MSNLCETPMEGPAGKRHWRGGGNNGLTHVLLPGSHNRVKLTSVLPPVSIFLDAFSDQVDVITQTVQHTRICYRHCGAICLLFQAIEPRDHLAGMVPASIGHLA